MEVASDTIVLPAPESIPILEHGNHPPTFAQALTVLASPDSPGLWCTTTGLGHYGLPELQRHHVPYSVGSAWMRVMTGIACHLADVWVELIRRTGASFIELPTLMTVSSADIANAYGLDSKRKGRAGVRLELDPRARGDSFLNIEPPSSSDPGWVATVCGNLVGVMPPVPEDFTCEHCEREARQGSRPRTSRSRR